MRPIDPLDAEEFLAACRSASATAYRRFEEILSALEDLATRGEARRFLARIALAFDRAVEAGEQPGAFHFQLGTLSIGRSEGALVLLQFPSVFAPEEWSRTFFEGLARYSPHDFAGRTLAELGCGNGWVTLALAHHAAPEKLYGLDINPRAITCARINLYLNALTSDGEPILDADGKSLLDRVEFHESDLLAWVREGGLNLDRVIGCIPQVLDPNLGELDGTGKELSDEFLVSLSNYTGHQGYLEDLFGLGLVARALEEAIEVMRPGGWVVLNLGGRPGREILRQMFCRRGLAMREIWSTRIAQADDTDISPLAEIERSGRHRFEFFLGVHSDEPVSARTAQAYARAGGAIFHSLTVFEGRLRFPEAMNPVFAALHGEEWRPVRNALDLDYEDDALVEEKSAFLARLARLLPERRAFPYGETLGALPFRQRFAEYLERYFAIPLGAVNLVALPNRASALRNLFTLYAPTLSLIHPSLQTSSQGQAIQLAFSGDVLECPLRADLACKLIAALAPQLVVTTLDAGDVRSPDSFLRLVETSGRAGARLVVDISSFFELDSTPRSNGVLQALSEAPLPAHVAILCGLVRNRVYRDLEVCFLLSEDDGLVTALENAAEMTYSRVPLFTQEYYDTILAELLSFRLDPLSPAVARSAGTVPGTGPGRAFSSTVALAERCRKAFEHPAIVAEHLPRTANTVRLDYGENALPSPTLVAASLFEAFARRELPAAEADPTAEVAQFLRRRFGIDVGVVGTGRLAPRFAFGLGVAPLFSSLAESCAAEGGTFVFPAGSYGYFVATVELFGGRWLRIATDKANGFKVTPQELDTALAGVARPWLFLNGPVVNPTGSLYQSDEIASLLAVAAKHRARVVIDVLFSGLEHAEGVSWDLGPVLADNALSLVLLGGVSKELAGGGLRFGFAWCHGEAIERSVARGLTATPHATTCFAAKRIFSGLNRPTPRTREELIEQRRLLAARAARLSAVLSECGWEPLPCHGGLFLVARPAAYLGRSFSVSTGHGEYACVLDSENIAEAMFWAVDLMINNSRWTGIPEHCRFVFSVETLVFEEGLRRIRAFWERVAKN
ncbi:MAG: aminotransferase class I/II-fold pyridoxal phosphate-dependent enzyme [Acidobacteriota bacterium]